MVNNSTSKKLAFSHQVFANMKQSLGNLWVPSCLVKCASGFVRLISLMCWTFFEVSPTNILPILTLCQAAFRLAYKTGQFIVAYSQIGFGETLSVLLTHCGTPSGVPKVYLTSVEALIFSHKALAFYLCRAMLALYTHAKIYNMTASDFLYVHAWWESSFIAVYTPTCHITLSLFFLIYDTTLKNLSQYA